MPLPVKKGQDVVYFVSFIDFTFDSSLQNWIVLRTLRFKRKNLARDGESQKSI